MKVTTSRRDRYSCFYILVLPPFICHYFLLFLMSENDLHRKNDYGKIEPKILLHIFIKTPGVMI